jgi:hypothetical protein
MEAIEVEIRKGRRKEIQPISFTCKGRTYRIVSIGRRWGAAKGEHILVMDTHDRTYHLFYAREDSQWYWVTSDNNPAKTPV